MTISLHAKRHVRVGDVVIGKNEPAMIAMTAVLVAVLVTKIPVLLVILVAADTTQTTLHVIPLAAAQVFVQRVLEEVIYAAAVENNNQKLEFLIIKIRYRWAHLQFAPLTTSPLAHPPSRNRRFGEGG